MAKAAEHLFGVDLVTEPDLVWHWKDSDEYAVGRSLGIVTDADHRAILSTRDQISSLLEQRAGPFADEWRCGTDRRSGTVCHGASPLA